MDAVLVERRRDVALVRLNRPKNRNALGPEIKAGLEACIPALMSDDTVRCLVITGTDGAFCAGGDIANMQDRSAPAVRRRLQASHEWAKLLLLGETPVIAAVNGAAAGAGFSIAMLCDIVLMSETAFVQAGFPGLGAVPDLGLAQTLPRAIGLPRAREILLTNRRVGAAEALSLGVAIATFAPDDLLPSALEMADRLAAGPKTSLGLTKRLLNEAYGSTERFLTEEGLSQAVAFGSPEFAEGVDAFLAKRKADFRSGRP